MAEFELSVRPIDVTIDPLDICGSYAEVGDVVLIGRWAGGGAIVADDPVAVTTDASEPFAGPIGDVGTATSTTTVGGGWFGTLGFNGASHWAWYPNIVRFDAGSGRWFDEALLGSLPAPELDRRRAAAVRRLRAHTSGGSRHPGTLGPFTASTARAGYERGVQAAQEHIRAGDIYQVNLCLALSAVLDGSSAGLFERLTRHVRPAFAAHLVRADGAVVSASPELFLRRTGRRVLSSPIKGTRPRPDDPDQARAEADRLQASVKDRAENVMIVDMVRNDLARVAATGSVRVTELLRLESHPGVWHLVSDVAAELREGASDAELLRATFPPGSVTGAPKVRALEIIDELEPVPRGLYTGAIGYRSPIIGLELSVAIRTLEISQGKARLGVGAGITAGSDPSAEWSECFDKAAPIVAALGGAIAPNVTVR